MRGRVQGLHSGECGCRDWCCSIAWLGERLGQGARVGTAALELGVQRAQDHGTWREEGPWPPFFFCDPNHNSVFGEKMNHIRSKHTSAGFGTVLWQDMASAPMCFWESPQSISLFLEIGSSQPHMVAAGAPRPAVCPHRGHPCCPGRPSCQGQPAAWETVSKAVFTEPLRCCQL